MPVETPVETAEVTDLNDDVSYEEGNLVHSLTFQSHDFLRVRGCYMDR